MRRPRRTHRKRWLIALAAVPVGVVVAVGCTSSPAPPAPPAVTHTQTPAQHITSQLKSDGYPLSASPPESGTDTSTGTPVDYVLGEATTAAGDTSNVEMVAYFPPNGTVLQMTVADHANLDGLTVYQDASGYVTMTGTLAQFDRLSQTLPLAVSQHIVTA